MVNSRTAEPKDLKKLATATIADLMAELPPEGRALPVVGLEAGLEEIVAAFAASNHSRLLYVVDAEQRLCGVVSFGRMVRHVFFHYHEPQYDTRGLIHMAFSETARDFMERDPLTARMSDGVEEVLAAMIRHNVKEVPIVDEELLVVADLTMIDLLAHFPGSLPS